MGRTGIEYQIIQYHKATRDRIPEIIQQEGRKCKIKVLPDPEFVIALENKLQEELNEYHESGDIEELCDILEVAYRIAELKGYSREELERIRTSKLESNGGFQNNLFLVEGEKKP